MHGIRDRRTSLRVEIDGEAVVYTERDVIEGRCLDLSREGLAIRSTRATRSKTPVTLELYIHGQRLRIEAVLVRRRRLHGDYVMGFRFIEVDLETSAKIDRLIFGRLAVSPHAELLLAFAAHHAATHGPAPTPTVEHTVVAAAGEMVPVISGYTQVVHVEQPPLVDRTVIAPPPTRTDTVRFGMEPGEPLPPAVDPDPSEDDWFEDEMDTAEIRLLEAAVGPDLALDSEPIPTELDVAEPDATETVEHTVVATAAAEPNATATVEHTVPVTAAAEPNATETVEHTVPVTAATAPSESTVVVTAPSGTIPLHPEATQTTGAPAPVTATRSSTMALTIDGEPTDEPSEGPRTATVPLLAPAFLVGPPRGVVMGRPDTMADAAVPSSSPSSPASSAPTRPTQRALRDAMALLRSSSGGPRPRPGPRVIVSIPHQTYRQRSASPWNR